MSNQVAKTGNEAVAEAMKQINPDVCAAYPITPATEIMQIFAQFVSDGIVDTELVTVESEHSAISACIGASAAGARVITATSSQGLALMHEILYIASSLRLPIVMADVNRALSGPINIHCDHSDTMGERDSGWIQIFSENSQEAYDNMIQAVRIAENPNVFLPTMVTLDGFIISHAMEGIQIYDTEKIRKFIGKHQGPYDILDTDNPVTAGALDLFDYYFEHKRSQIEAMNQAIPHIMEVAKEFKKEFGKEYGLVERYKLDDAEYAIVALGSTAGTAKYAIDELRSKGIKAGMLKIRLYRPFPEEEIRKSMAHVKVIGVLDRSTGLNAGGGPLFNEIRSAFYDLAKKPEIYDYIYGLGGRDINTSHIKSVFDELSKKPASRVSYINLRS